MRKLYEPQTRVPGARPRIDPDTLMPMYDDHGKMLWDMPAPSKYAEHKVWRLHKRTGKRIADTAMVPIYRGTSGSHARDVKAQIKRSQRKAAEAQAVVEEMNAAEDNAARMERDNLQNLVLNPGGHNVEE